MVLVVSITGVVPVQAERHVGELVAKAEKAKGARGQLRGRPSGAPDVTARQDSQSCRPWLDQAGNVLAGAAGRPVGAVLAASDALGDILACRPSIVFSCCRIR